MRSMKRIGFNIVKAVDHIPVFSHGSLRWGLNRKMGAQALRIGSIARKSFCMYDNGDRNGVLDDGMYEVSSHGESKVERLTLGAGLPSVVFGRGPYRSWAP